MASAVIGIFPSQRLIGASVFALLSLAAASALATQTEPNGMVVPVPNTVEDMTTVANYGHHSTLDLLFSSRGETIDSRADANTTPAVFSPRCNFAGTLVLHGGTCQMDFGWYNVNISSADPPPDDQIFVLVPRDANQGFSPLVGDTGLSTFSSDDILSDPRWQGGTIGFATKNSRQGACSQTHYSELRLSSVCDDGTGHCAGPSGPLPAGPWIVMLSYQSTASPNAYYLAFEDLPGGGNDGDFNDDVYFITGVACTGAGASCATGQMGVCGIGIQRCAKAGGLACVPTNASSKEVCDGLDNDCNGVVDDGADICPAGLVCDRGACLARCAAGGCQAPQVCTAEGVCGDAACQAVVDCPAGTRCGAGGACAPQCEGVTCPAGEACRGGACVDACLGVKCDDGFVCLDGACQQGCDCLGCPTGSTCGAGRTCVEDACKGVTCAVGSTCKAGTCVDNCVGAVCPAGQMCQAGTCVDPCAGTTCASGQRCVGGACVDACVGVTCGAGQKCQAGACVDTCSATCDAPKVCRQGTCVDPCAGVTCAAGQACRGGTCQDACVGVACAATQKCVGGACIDACLGINCPDEGLCVAGACRVTCTATDCPTGQACVDGHCLDACGDGGACPPGNACSAAGSCLPVAPPATAGNGKSGCGCALGSDGAPSAAALGLSLIGAAWARRRRRPR